MNQINKLHAGEMVRGYCMTKSFAFRVGERQGCRESG